MTEKHFYVENARLMSYGLSNIGTGKTTINITGNEPIEVLAGKLIGLGFHNESGNLIESLVGYTTHQNDFIRKSAYIGLSFSGFLQSSEKVNEVFERGFYDPELEVRKTALIGFGLANIYNSDQSLNQVLEIHLHDEEWKIRSASGLAFSFLSNGNPQHFSKFLNLLRDETSPYVKVCSCWSVSNAFAGTRKGLNEFKELLSLNGDENSYFRDMACLGLGLSFLGTSEPSITELLEDIIKDDNHPYVRESAFFGLALCNYQNPNEKIMKILKKGLNDDSMIVRSGAALSHGIINMGKRSLYLKLDEYSDSSILWGLTISEGLANIKPSKTKFHDNYVQWGYNISNVFRDNLSINFDTIHPDISSFQNGINAGLIGSGITKKQQKDSVRLIVPGLFNYLIYDSFWWGLWVLNALGITLHKGIRK
ncbi:MAG: hypothetical protein KAT68_17015 [Bacteroidales bacterium]|nr:hypothetical protein [Bacteroidales bacterium]